MNIPISRQPEPKPQVQRDTPALAQKPLPGKGLYDAIKPSGIGIGDIVKSQGRGSLNVTSGDNRIAVKGWKGHIQATIKEEKRSIGASENKLDREARAGAARAEREDEAIQKKSDSRLAAMSSSMRGKMHGEILQKDKQWLNSIKSSFARIPKFIVSTLVLKQCMTKKISDNDREIDKTFATLKNSALSLEEQKKIKARRVKLVYDNAVLIKNKRLIAGLPDDLLIDLMKEEGGLPANKL